MDHPAGAGLQRADRVEFDPRVRLEFRGTQLSSDGGLLVMRDRRRRLGRKMLVKWAKLGDLHVSQHATWVMSRSRKTRMEKRPLITLSLPMLLLFAAQQASANACDYRPSNLFGGGTAGAVAATGGSVAVAGAAAQAAGFYTLTHSVTGLTMLASTAGGASAAGTVGIMGGTAGAIGTVASIVMAPVTIIAGAILAVGVAGYEGVCYFTVERVEDPKILLGIVENMVDNGDPRYIRLTTLSGEMTLMIASEHDDNGEPVKWDKFSVANLYIEDGILKHRDYGPNSKIGRVQLVQAPAKE